MNNVIYQLLISLILYYYHCHQILQYLHVLHKISQQSKIYLYLSHENAIPSVLSIPILFFVAPHSASKEADKFTQIFG